ncbi:putative WRKY transcription factor 65 [Dorcoceras hygrometricum]|uniref:Putative WRKY transcription factor 65 n=1 Tax=Dorcoceras hygrometricum TaxID=472368 RepID=A0A2Z7B775_9LAMI|nr:putative WRKY transcription factor 65 [Dorcoceras hygrometricum]
MSTINTSSLSDHLPPAPTADYPHSMKTSEPKAQQGTRFVSRALTLLLGTLFAVIT